MSTATTARMIARVTKGSSFTSLSEMTMISAERMKSVRIAPLVIVFSSATCPSSCALPAASSPWPLTRSQIFSTPSKQR